MNPISPELIHKTSNGREAVKGELTIEGENPDGGE